MAEIPQNPQELLQMAAAAPQQNVMDQFNAIRGRIDTVPSQIESPGQGGPTDANSVEVKMISRPFKDAPGDNGKVVITGYSTGEPKTDAEFKAALASYNKVGNKVKGFTFLEPSMEQKVRDTFESTVGSPMRAAAAGIQASPDMPSTSPYVPDMVQKPVAAVANMLKGVAASVPQGISTPEGLGTAAGMTAASFMLPGLGPIGQALKGAAGAGAGYLAGDIAAGTNKGNFDRRLYETSKTAIEAGLTEGAIGVFKNIIGTSLSHRAQQDVADDMMQYIKDKYRPLMNDPNAFKAITNSPTGIRDVVQMGVKGLRGDVDDIANTQVKEVVKGLHGLGVIDPVDIKTLQSNMKKLVTKQNQWIDNIGGDTVKMVKVTDEVNRLMEDVMSDAMSIVKKLPATQSAAFQQRYQQQVYSLLEGYAENVRKISDAVPLFDALKKAGADRQFDVKRFQSEVQNYFMSQPGSDVNVMGKKVFRGSKGESVDAPYSVDIPYGHLLDKVPGLHLIPGIGQLKGTVSGGMNYVGKVKGSYPVTTAGIQAGTISSIREYLDEK